MLSFARVRAASSRVVRMAVRSGSQRSALMQCLECGSHELIRRGRESRSIRRAWCFRRRWRLSTARRAGGGLPPRRHRRDVTNRKLFRSRARGKFIVRRPGPFLRGPRGAALLATRSWPGSCRRTAARGCAGAAAAQSWSFLRGRSVPAIQSPSVFEDAVERGDLR